MTFLKKLWNKIANEPVLLINIINAGFVLCVAFGIDINEQQKAAIIMLTTVLLNLFARSLVTPTRKLSS